MDRNFGFEQGKRTNLGRINESVAQFDIFHFFITCFQL